jgi:hypothetical protein
MMARKQRGRGSEGEGKRENVRGVGERAKDKM